MSNDTFRGTCFLCETPIRKNSETCQIATAAAGKILSLVLTLRGVEMPTNEMPNETCVACWRFWNECKMLEQRLNESLAIDEYAERNESQQSLPLSTVSSANKKRLNEDDFIPQSTLESNANVIINSVIGDEIDVIHFPGHVSDAGGNDNSLSISTTYNTTNESRSIQNVERSRPEKSLCCTKCETKFKSQQVRRKHESEVHGLHTQRKRARATKKSGGRQNEIIEVIDSDLDNSCRLISSLNQTNANSSFQQQTQERNDSQDLISDRNNVQANKRFRIQIELNESSIQRVIGQDQSFQLSPSKGKMTMKAVRTE